jgi:plastocyanin
MNPKVYLRERILTPVVLTVLAGAIIITIIINVSRVLLAVGGDKGIYVSSGIAAAILGTAIWAATRPKLPQYSGMFILAFAGIAAMIAGSISFNRAEPHEATAAEVPYATEEAIVGQPGGGPLVFDKSTLAASVSEAAPGIRIDLSSGSGTHTWTVHGFEGELVLQATPAAPASGTIVLQPGTYNYYCDVPGHEAAGMKGVLTVTADPNATPIGGTGGAGSETSVAAG